MSRAAFDRLRLSGCGGLETDWVENWLRPERKWWSSRTGAQRPAGREHRKRRRPPFAARHGAVIDPISTGGAEGDRTPDLVIANDALSHLSYGPVPVSPCGSYPLKSAPPTRRDAPRKALCGGSARASETAWAWTAGLAGPLESPAAARLPGSPESSRRSQGR